MSGRLAFRLSTGCKPRGLIALVIVSDLKSTVIFLHRFDVSQSDRGFGPRCAGRPWGLRFGNCGVRKAGQKCQRIDFLHSAGFNAPEGSQIGAYVMRYANGQTREWPLVHAQNIHCGFWSPWRARDLGPDCVIAWHGANAGSNALNCEIYLFKTTWVNPMPEETIASLDFISALGEAAPLLVAVTLE
jgi:hypothetical protein